MLGRKQSLRGELLPYELAQEEINNESVGVDWMNKLWMKRLLRLSALVCLCSVSLNTPKTFELYPFLRPVTFACDLITGLLFTAEMIIKITTRGLLKGEDSYLRDRWCLFDSSMLFFLWVSVILQTLELSALVPSASYLSILRAPRPLIMIRFIRVFLKFSMPKNRINQIFKRSGQQIYNVTLFFLFFMSLYGLLGVQFFGELRNHCILNDTDPEHVTINSLTIPDTYCSMDSSSGYQCPEGTVCTKLKASRYKLGFNGFDEIATSIFTVYQAFSQEGWVFIMYRAVDTLPAWRAFMYFTTMIFFLSWLVKNVFIAVITETFNEIRVQFQQMWGQRGSQLADIVDARAPIISGDDRGWKLVPTDATRHQYRTVLLFLPVLNSAAFHLLLMVAILANGLVTASMSFKHDGRPRSDFYQQHYYIEVGFTVFFNLEALFKMWCLGFRDYYGRTIYKFELLLVIGTTLHLLPQFYLSALTYFQVLRVVRLIKASPLLEDFVYKIFGPGKKLGSLIIFTMCLLIITSSISMQLFCFLADFTKFETFPEAFMSMFQILTQEAWVEVMDETMWRTSETIVPVVAIYFILYHLFVTLIVLSLFVAVILDNLELDEDIKKLKQMKAREQSAEIKKTLPRRLRLFEKFPDRPQMTRLHKVPSDFNLPKVRDSFVRQFMLETGDDEDLQIDKSSDDSKANSKVLYRKKQPLRLLNSVICTCVSGTNQKQNAITGIINESNNQRLLLGDSGPIPIPGTGKQGMAGQKGNRQDQKKAGHRSFRGSVKIKQTYEHLKENGDLGAMNRTSTSRRTPDIDIKLLQAKRQQAEMRRNQREEDLRENHPYFDTPLFLVPRESGFRHLCQRMVYARYCPRLKDPITGKERKLHYKRFHNLVGLVTYLDWVMIFVTTLSCLSMMFETPRYRLCEHRELQIAEFGFVIFMSLELGLKILADGLFFTPKALFKDAAGVLDLFTFAVGLAMLCWMPHVVPQNSGAQLLLLLRCLRPLRIFILVPHMRKVVCELCRGFKEILLVSILLIVLMFVFASYGVQLYGGRLARCNDSEIKTRDQCVGVFLRKVFVTKMKLAPGDHETHPAILVPRVWANPRRFNFDNIGNAMLALFEVLSFKGWLDIRDVLIKTLGPVHAIYIHIFVFLGCMIGLTLFVGVVIANYSENKGTALLTVDQRRWCDLKKRLKIAQPLHLPPRPEGHRFRAFIYDITQHIYFKRFIALMVILNSSLLCVSWREDQAHTSLLATISSCLSFVFVAEVSMKMIAFTPHGYWQSRRNRYDTLVTVMGLVWAITNYTMANDLSHSFGFVAIILRFFTITGKHATLKMLMLTVVVSVYKSFFIIMGMFLLIFVYALTGCLLFGTVKYGESVGRQANFSSTPRGIIMLFRIVTGEDWYKIMHDCMVLPPFCTPGANFWETDCGNFTAAMIFFCSFYVIITYIVLNLLVAIIMENFSLFYSNEEDALLSYADIRNFQNTWNVVDVNQRGVIPVRKVKFVLRLLKGRLEVDPQKDRLLFKHMCFELERLHNGEDVTFHDVLNMLSYRSVDIRKSLQLEELLAREELEYIIEEEVAKQTIRQWLDSCLKRMKTINIHDAKEHNSLLAGLRATNDQLQEAQEEKGREFGAGVTERDATEVKEAEGSGKHRRKGMLVTRSDSINSVSGRRLFYTPHGEGLSQQRSSYDKERLGVSSNPKKRPSRQSAGKMPSSSFSHSGGECSPGASPTCPTTGLVFPYSSMGIGASTWSGRGPGHSLPPLAPPSALAVRVSSVVGEVQDWWRDQLASPDGSDDDTH